MIRDALSVVRQRARLSCVVCNGHAYPLPHGVTCPINDNDHADVHADGNGIVVTTDGRPHDGGTDLRAHITYRPMLFPTGSIRKPKVPTRSPAPTIASAPPPPPNNHPKRKRVNRQCSHQNCDNRVVQGGVCVTHSARRKCCAHPGCEKSVRHSGYCSAHGPSWQNATMPTPMMTTTMEAAAGTEEERGGDNNAMVIHHEVPPPCWDD